MATISFRGSVSTPADSGTNTSSTATITTANLKDAGGSSVSAQTGDLCIITAQPRSSSPSWDDFSITTTGGQEWMELTDDSFGRTNLGAKKWMCVFTGSWAANPVVTFVASVNFEAIMTVYQHDAGSTKRWRVSTPVSISSKAAATTFTISAITLPTQPCVVEVTYGSSGLNTWGSLTAGWTFANPSGGTQVRSGTNMSLSIAYKVFTSTGSTGSVAATQSASTAGLTSIVAFDLEDTLTSNPPTPPSVDLYLDGEQSTNGSTLTVTDLTNMTRHTDSGTWATSGGTPTNTKVATAAQSKLNPNSVKVSSTSYDDNSGTRGIRYDHTAGNLTPSWLYSMASPTSHAIVSMGFWYQTTMPYTGGSTFPSYSSMAMFCSGTEFGVFNVLAQHAADHSARLETNDASGAVLGPRIVNSTWYWVTIQLDTTTGVAWMSIWTWGGSSWTQKGYTVGMPASTANPVNSFQVFCTGGGYVALASGDSYYDNIVLDWTNHTFPLLPGQTATGKGPPFFIAQQRKPLLTRRRVI
jgi:hypothetical protein